MEIEQERVGEVAARMMGTLESHGYGEQAQITDVMLIVAVDFGDGDTVHMEVSPVMARHVALGLVTHVQNQITSA